MDDRPNRLNPLPDSTGARDGSESAPAVARAESLTAPAHVPELSDTPPQKSLSTIRGWRRGLYLGGAGFFFVLGALGAFLPGLPATPFLLLCSYFLVRTSPRLNQRLMQSRLFGPILVDWQVHGGVRPDVKVQAIACVAVAVGLTVWLSGRAFWPTLVVLGLALVGIVVIIRLPSVPRR